MKCYVKHNPLSSINGKTSIMPSAVVCLARVQLQRAACTGASLNPFVLRNLQLFQSENLGRRAS